MQRERFGGDHARDTHYEGLGDDYARDGGWSGAGRADDVVSSEHDGIDATDVEVSVDQEGTLSRKRTGSGPGTPPGK